MEHPESQFATADDGAPIAYRSYGQGEPAVLICNGIGCNQAYLRYLIRDLAPRHRTVIWDYRGHLDSPGPADPRDLTIDRCLADMEAVVAAAGLERMVLAGFSMGVQISLEYIRRHRERALGFIALLGTAEHPLRTFMNLHGLGERAVPILLGLVRAMAPHGQRLWHGILSGPWVFPLAKLAALNPKAARREDFESWRAHLADMDAETFLQMAVYLGQHSARDLLPTLDMPCLVVAGEKDNFTPLAVNRDMVALIPEAEFLVVEGGTHGGLFEFPEQIDERVLRFMAEHF